MRRLRPVPGLRALVLASALVAGCGVGPAPFVDDPLVARVYQVVPPDITVRNDDGVINLTGFIEGVGNEGRIVEAVASIPGVRSVDSNLIVRGDDG